MVGSSILTASAASSQCLFNPENFSLTSVKISGDNAASWVDPYSYGFTTNENGSGRFWVNNTNVITYITHWRASFDPLSGAGDLLISSGMNLTSTFYYQHHAAGNYHTQTITGALYITAPDGSVYEFPVTDQSSSEDQTFYFITVGGTVGVVEPFRFQDCSIELVCSGLTVLTGVTLDFNQFNLTVREPIGEETAKVVETVEQGFADLMEQQKDNTQDIIDNQDKNTQDIIDNDNANAEKTHGFLQSIWDAIVAIPAQIWEFIETGLKDLFVPDQAYIVSYKDKWDSLLSSRFGAVYEAFDIVMEFANSINASDETDTISIPRVSIPLPDNNEFVFGPYDVRIVPDAAVLQFLVDTCKMITTIVAVFALVNGLRKRWEEVMDAG